MFQWDKSINDVNVPASEVLHLFRSMREVQLALPGLPAQQASSFLCQYKTEGGIGTVIVFHMHKSEVLAFFPTEPHVVPEQKIESMLDQGLNFVESMGFLMTDQDIHLLDESDQEMLWSSLPLKSGLSGEGEAVPEPAQEKKTQPEVKQQVEPAPEKKVPQPEPESEQKAPVEAVKHAPKADAEPENAENVDDLLAAVEAMRAKRPGLRARKMPPAPEEMERRRQQLRETVGRVLASL